jgi:hypothetical protein
MSIERRFHPRRDVNFSVSIVLKDSEQQLTSTAINISLSGVLLSADKVCVDFILSHTNHPAQFQIILNEDKKLGLMAVRLMVNRRISQNNFLLALKFINITVEQLTSIKALLSQQINEDSQKLDLKSQISLTDTRYYHLISRCVRRTFQSLDHSIVPVYKLVRTTNHHINGLG